MQENSIAATLFMEMSCQSSIGHEIDNRNFAPVNSEIQGYLHWFRSSCGFWGGSMVLTDSLTSRIFEGSVVLLDNIILQIVLFFFEHS
jgi:hypothetical protein